MRMGARAAARAVTHDADRVNRLVVLPASASIGFVHLTVGDLGRVAGFYREVIGFKEAHRADNRTVFLSATGAYPFHIGLTGDPKARPRARRTAGLYHQAILVPSRADLGRSLRHVLKSGWPIQGASDHGVSEAVYFADPEGNGIEIYADRPRDRWTFVRDRLTMGTKPMDVDAVLAEGEGRWEGLSPGTRIGHVHLQVSDLAKAEAFYTHVIGFEVTVRAYAGALFFAAGEYHHHVGVNIWAGTDLAPASPEIRGLRHFTIRLPDRTALAQTVERLRAARLGFEAYDHGLVLAVYARDPDAITVALTVDADPQAAWKEEALQSLLQ
jgi:catechol 2,3-dioxygenase